MGTEPRVIRKGGPRGGGRRRGLGRGGMALVWLLAAGLAGCGEDSTGPSGPIAATIPTLDLSAAEPPVAERITQARKAVERNPGSTEAWGHLGVVLDAHGFFADAVACYRRAGQLAPQDVRWPYLIGLVLAFDDPNSAIDAFERAIAIGPESAVIMSYCADALVRAGWEDKARRRYEAALEADTKCRKARLGLGELAIRRGALEEAQVHLQRAAAIDFYDRQVHAKLARVYRRLGDASRAEREALLVRAYPDLGAVPDPIRAQVTREAVSSKARTKRGLAYVARGQYAEAETEFRRALAVRPDSVRNHLNLGGVFLRQGQIDSAIDIFRQTLGTAPDDPEVHNNLAVALLEDGRLREAADLLHTALRLAPKHDGAHYNLGTLRERQGKTDEAAAFYRQALAINPVNARAHQALANLLERSGRPDEAVSHWRAAVDFGRHPREPTLHLAVIFARQGRFGEAVPLLHQGRRRAPNDVPLLAALVTILASCPDERYRDGPQAVFLALRLVSILGPEHLPSLVLLAAAQAETGQFEAAIRTCDRSLALAHAAGQTDLAGEIRARLQLYRAGRPYHQK